MLTSALLALLLAQSAPKPLPPPGIAVPEGVRAALQPDLAKLASAIEDLTQVKCAGPHLADVRVFHKAVDWALRYNQFYKPEEFQAARTLLDIGLARAAALKTCQAPWARATGLVPLAYQSHVDDSVQPYGLVIPASWSPDARGAWRLDVWFHGRGETLSELAFLQQRMKSPGEFTPPDTFVLHLYGRYCIANKFAGEVDVFEALEDVKRRYRIDENRILVRGFSMGGAATWHIAAHHAGMWAAAAPGAGFAETQGYLKISNEDKKALPWWEPKLWNWYDATAYAANFFNTPLVAYSGENDRQKQAADVMSEALSREGMKMTHIIGPKTEHKYHPQSKMEIDRRLNAIAAAGRVAVPKKVKFTTFTLRYHRMKWISLEGLDEHWERARIEAEIREPNMIVVRGENVNAFTIEFRAGEFPFDAQTKPVVMVNGITVQTMPCESDRSWKAAFHRDGPKWALGAAPAGLRKRPGLQGPIDDAFISRFLFVRPTGQPADARAHEWSVREMQFAALRYQNLFRGEVRIKDDRDVTEADILDSNLILWGDASSNAVWAKIAGRLPLRASTGEVLLMTYPNPLNPERYAVFNSGHTFREESNATNARQIPMLPDWALVDISTAPGARYPGRITNAGFFDEAWKIKPR